MKKAIPWIIGIGLLIVGGLWVVGQIWSPQEAPTVTQEGFTLLSIREQGHEVQVYHSELALAETFTFRVPDDVAPAPTSASTSVTETQETMPVSNLPEWQVYNPLGCACFLLNDQWHPMGALACQSDAVLAKGTYVGVYCPAGEGKLNAPFKLVRTIK